MKILKILGRVLVLVCISAVTNLRAQDSVRVVILSSRVGSEIDLQERDYFRVFGEIKGFQRAVVFRRPDSTYYIHIVYQSSMNTLRDTLIEIREVQVYMLAEKINHFEGLLDGTYRFGLDPARLRYDDGQSVLKAQEIPPLSQSVRTAQHLPNRLPLVPDSVDEGLIVEYPILGYGIGLSSYSPDFSGLIQAFREVENKYRLQGYDVGQHTPSFSVAGVFWINVVIQFSQDYKVIIEGGSQTGGNVKFASASLTLQRNFFYHSYGSLHPYVGLGIGRYRVSMEESYKAPVSTYSYLDAIEINAANFGLHVDAGIEGGSAFVWNVGVSYLAIPAATKTTMQGVDAVIVMKSFTVGGRISVFF